VQKGRDRFFFIESMFAGETQHIDAAKIAIAAFANGALDGGGAIGVSRLPQYAEKGVRLAHLNTARAG
jgi:hypothetical protein